MANHRVATRPLMTLLMVVNGKPVELEIEPREMLLDVIRDRLGLDAGSMLDFQLLADNTITVRPVKPDARRVRGVLKSPHAAALTVEQMDEGIAKHLREKHGAKAGAAKSSRR